MQDYVFISYSRKDQKFVLGLEDELRNLGIDVWIDQGNILGGDTWHEEISVAIDGCVAFILVLSKNAIRSQEVSRELSLAYNKNKKRIPVVIEDVIIPPTMEYPLVGLHYLDFREEKFVDNLLMLQKSISKVDASLEPPKPKTAAVSTKTDTQMLSLEYPTGVVRPDSEFYVERECDEYLRAELQKAGSTTTIRGGRQSGKTSLLMRGIQSVKQQGHSVIYLDFQLIPDENRLSLDILLLHIAKEIAYKLHISEAEVDKIWQSSRGAPDKFSQFLYKKVLIQIEQPILLAMDEVDCLLDAAYKTQFFSLVRAWDTKRAYNELWQKLNVVMAISNHPLLLIDDFNLSPFNVGKEINLLDFEIRHLVILNNSHGNPLRSEQLGEMKVLLGGQPYLSRMAFYHLVTEGSPWSKFSTSLIDDGDIFRNHLELYWLKLKNETKIVDALREIIKYSKCEDDEIRYRLIAVGLVKETGYKCLFRCAVYEAFFKRKLQIG